MFFFFFQASWPGSTRQMTLVPSWQQLANPANAAEANLLQPLFAAAASDADWRRPLIVDSSGGLRLQAEQAAAVFPAVVYERAAVAASASRGSSSYNKRSSKASSTGKFVQEPIISIEFEFSRQKICIFCHLVRKSDDERTSGWRILLQIICLSYVNNKLILKKNGGNFESLEILVHLLIK